MSIIVVKAVNHLQYPGRGTHQGASLDRLWFCMPLVHMAITCLVLDGVRRIAGDCEECICDTTSGRRSSPQNIPSGASWILLCGSGQHNRFPGAKSDCVAKGESGRTGREREISVSGH